MGVIVILLFLIVFFYPKPSSVEETWFSVQQRNKWEKSQGVAISKPYPIMNKCNCIGFEEPYLATSYSESYRCYGIVLSCKETEVVE